MPTIYTTSASAAATSTADRLRTSGVIYTWTGFEDEPIDRVPRKSISKSNLSFLAEAERSIRGRIKC